MSIRLGCLLLVRGVAACGEAGNGGLTDGGQNCLPGEPDPPAPLVTADDIRVAHTPGCGRRLPRPAVATPLEFAPRLEEHFGSPVPGEVRRAFAEARYGRRPRAEGG